MDEIASTYTLSLLRRLEPNDTQRAAVRRLGGKVLRAGPFEVYLHPDPRAPGFGYAQPIEPLPPDSDVLSGVDELRALFASRGLPLSIEFNGPLFLGLPPLLEAAGLVVSEREPLQVLDPAGFTPVRAADVDVRFLQPSDSDRTLSDYQRIFTEVLLERPYEETPERLARLRDEVKKCGGGSHALAIVDGRAAGTGFVSTAEGVSEIARVATLPHARRRGVASTLTSVMLEEHLGPGSQVAWLTAASRPAQLLYEKLGFRLVGERLYYAEP
jgi:ribosomal protein S18 acetylase RimI-like enzyme